MFLSLCRYLQTRYPDPVPHYTRSNPTKTIGSTPARWPQEPGGAWPRDAELVMVDGSQEGRGRRREGRGRGADGGRKRGRVGDDRCSAGG
jgi:hypothetical protein